MHQEIGFTVDAYCCSTRLPFGQILADAAAQTIGGKAFGGFSPAIVS